MPSDVWLRTWIRDYRFRRRLGERCEDAAYLAAWYATMVAGPPRADWCLGGATPHDALDPARCGEAFCYTVAHRDLYR